MQEILKKFYKIIADPYKSVKEWKKRTGKKVIGVFPMWIAEEIIHAGGMLPVVIWRGDEPVTWRHAHLPPFNCGLTRSFVDDAVKGKLSFMDGMVFYRMCLQSMSLPFIIERNAQPKPVYLKFLYLPPLYRAPSTKEFLIDELKILKESIEEFSGEKITVESLNRSIQIYNKNRELLRKIYEVRKEKPELLKARDILAIVQSSMLMPKEEHNKMLEETLEYIEKRKPSAPKPKGEVIKVILSGCLCQKPSFDILNLIEELGMVVIDDDMYIGSRYFANDVAVCADPIKALAERYMKNEPVCPTKGESEKNWGIYLAEVAKRNNADGIITLLVKFCPPHLTWYPEVKRRLAEAGVPEIMIEVEHEVTSLEAIRTRLASFVEMIKLG